MILKITLKLDVFILDRSTL